MLALLRTPLALSFLLASAAALPSCKSKEATSNTGEVAKLPTTGDDAGVETDAPQADAAPFALEPAPPLAATPLGMPNAPSPDYNATTAEKVALGSELFVDPSLSANGETACASCHDPAHGFSSPESINKTAAGTANQRHTPSLVNIAYHSEFYWDGRTSPLEAHILGHWQGQLGLAPAKAVERMATSERYVAHFTRAFDSEPDRDRAAEALAAYVRSLVRGNSKWDRYEAGDATAVSKDAIAGSIIFNERAGCATCHAPPLYTDLKYHNLGLPTSAPPDVGRGAHTGHTNDQGAFKTPGLRGVSQSAPYFHNGSAATLIQVLEHKESQGSPRLTPLERRQVIAFLETLTGEPLP
tara:strand:+ start:8093 stop:9157 length:1065 start_codon:yes stop_codon:yes gene_type:complete